MPSFRSVPDCGANVAMVTACRMTSAPTLAQARVHLRGTRGIVWTGDDQLVVAIDLAEDTTSEVWIQGGIQLPLSRFAGSGIRAISLRIAGLDCAIITLPVQITGPAGFRYDTLLLGTYRGPRAPPAPAQSRRLHGTLQTDTITSQALGELRTITWYRPATSGTIPVVYLTDGAVVARYGPMLDTLIANRTIPPVALVGSWPGRRPASAGPHRGVIDDWRAVEYLEDVARAAPTPTDSLAAVRRHASHRRFFLDELPAWAESRLGVSHVHRSIFGVSNGAAFAILAARVNASQFEAVLALSHGPPEALASPSSGWAVLPPHYLAFGTLEPRLARVMRSLADSLRVAGVPVVLTEYPGGHDAAPWDLQFVRAVRWWLGGAPGR